MERTRESGKGERWQEEGGRGEERMGESGNGERWQGGRVRGEKGVQKREEMRDEEERSGER